MDSLLVILCAFLHFFPPILRLVCVCSYFSKKTACSNEVRKTPIHNIFSFNFFDFDALYKDVEIDALPALIEQEQFLQGTQQPLLITQVHISGTGAQPTAHQIWHASQKQSIKCQTNAYKILYYGAQVVPEFYEWIVHADTKIVPSSEMICYFFQNGGYCVANLAAFLTKYQEYAEMIFSIWRSSQSVAIELPYHDSHEAIAPIAQAILAMVKQNPNIIKQLVGILDFGALARELMNDLVNMFDLVSTSDDMLKSYWMLLVTRLCKTILENDKEEWYWQIPSVVPRLHQFFASKNKYQVFVAIQFVYMMTFEPSFITDSIIQDLYECYRNDNTRIGAVNEEELKFEDIPLFELSVEELSLQLLADMQKTAVDDMARKSMSQTSDWNNFARGLLFAVISNNSSLIGDVNVAQILSIIPSAICNDLLIQAFFRMIASSETNSNYIFPALNYLSVELYSFETKQAIM